MKFYLDFAHVSNIKISNSIEFGAQCTIKSTEIKFDLRK